MFDTLQELELAKQQSDALQTLLYDVMPTQEDSCYGDAIRFGILELMHQTSDRMDRAIEAVNTMLAQNAEVAS